MRPIQRVISAGFATAAIASASLPALSGSVWPNVDFEWYAQVGKGRVQQADASTAVTREQRTAPGAFEARSREPNDSQGARAGDSARDRAAPPPASATFPTGPATTRGPDTAIATPTTPAAADEVSRR